MQYEIPNASYQNVASHCYNTGSTHSLRFSLYKFTNMLKIKRYSH